MSDSSERDWGSIMVQMAAVYGFKPWDVLALTEDQLTMYMRGIGPARLMRDLPALQAMFGKLDDKAIEKLIAEAAQKADPNSLRSRGWRVFIRQYLSDQEEADQVVQAAPVGLSVGAAAALVGLVETGELMKYPNGSLMWRLRLLPIWKNLLATLPE